MTALEQVIAYHERTKHHPHRYARSLGYLDWANQPDPFRRFAGAKLFRLPFAAQDTTPSYESLYEAPADPAPLNAESIGRFLEMSLAISAWKEYQGTRWALRCNPSSGNLHPTEGYIAAGAIHGLSDSPNVYHYASAEHALELRGIFEPGEWSSLIGHCPDGTFFAGLTSIHWREAWKYGERAFRYCQHDAGHAMAAFSYAAFALGWRAVHLDAMPDDAIARLLGIDRLDEFPAEEREHPDALFAIVPSREPFTDVETFPNAVEWFGGANALSDEHVRWEAIEHVAVASQKPGTPVAKAKPIVAALPATGHRSAATAKAIFQQRRSAVDMDGRTSISRDAFYTMLDRTLPRSNRPPWNAIRFAAAIHLGIFVHRVEGLEPGIYMLVRNPDALDALTAATKGEFLWETPPGCADGGPLFGLGYGDCRSFAAQASCGQAIAGDSAFSLGMIADFQGTLDREGAWAYRRLFWEAGMVGQVLYLEAEAAGIRSTGIGCYFDDVIHNAFGLSGHAFQSMYHFTVGGPVLDDRLTTLAPYAPERRGISGWTD